MKQKELLAKVDHTLLRPESTWEEIKNLIDDAIKYETASVCIPPSFVERAAEYAGGNMPICTVIGFPNGYMSTAVKVFEALDAIAAGASEIDMVINIGDVKSGNWDQIEQELTKMRGACEDKILKVIIETCLLTEDEKIKLCKLVTKTGADYIKTSTGFSTAGATFEDVALLRREVGPKVKVKAAGGISTLEDAERFIELGADRLGTSRVVKLIKEMQKDEKE